MPVASAEAPILAMLLPSSSAPIIRSRIANRLETTRASRLPCFDSRNMLARDAAVSAVSLAEKNAETNRQAITMENANQSMRCRSLHLSLQHDLFKKAGLDVSGSCLFPVMAQLLRASLAARKSRTSAGSTSG